MEIYFEQINGSGVNVVNINKKESLDFNKALKEIKSYYMEKFNQIRILHFLEKRSIEDIYVNLMIIKEKKRGEEDSNELKERNAYLYELDSIYDEKEKINISDFICKSTKNNNTRALIFGTAGVGKTTLCKYISYNWAIGKLFNEFELLIYLPLRDWRNDTLKENIETYYPNIMELDKEVNIEEILKRKVLFIFDGYDELRNEVKDHFKRSLNVVKNYIITSRPYGYYHGELDTNESFENIGFTYDSIEEYIHKYFGSDSNKAKELIKVLKRNYNIYQISHIPLLLELVCYAYNHSKNKNKFSLLNMAELYSEVIDDIFKEHMAKNKGIVITYEQDRKKIKEIIGKLAFEGLKNKIVVFKRDFVIKVLTANERKYLRDKAMLSGFLKSSREQVDIFDNDLEFIHLTFQEYLAAYYVNCSIERENLSKYVYQKHMRVFFLFLAGLDKLSKKAK